MITETPESAVPAVVIGLDSLQGLQAARILRGHGIPVHAVTGDPEHHACSTNSCREILCCDTGSEELVATLAALGERLGSRAVLFPCQDKSVRVVSRHREALARHFEIALPAHDTVEKLMDKDAFHRYAGSLGLPLPETRELDNDSDPEPLVRDMPLPCLVKPARRSARWDSATRRKVFLVKNRDELRETIRSCRQWCDRVVLQQWINGGDDCLYSCNVCYGKKGRPLATFVARKLRQWPTDAGSSCLGEEVRDDTVLETALKLFDSVDYRGLGYLEMKRDADSGRYYVIEPNIGRPTGRSAIAEGGGVELLYTMYCDVLGLPLPANREQRYGGAKWIDLRHDLQSAWCYWRRRELTLPEWLRSMRGPKTHAVFSWRDPKPFFVDLLNAAGLVLRRRQQQPSTTG